MASDLNYCSFIGRLGKDPEIRQMAGGDTVANFSIAVGESWKNKQTGEKEERTAWVNLVAWRKLGEIVGKYLKKGSRVFVSGKMQTRKWQDQNGADRYTTEIVVSQMQMLDPKPSGQQDQQQNTQASSQPAPQQQAPQPAPQGGGDGFAPDLDIPF
jgi:single-strand DNA-binding protein